MKIDATAVVNGVTRDRDRHRQDHRQDRSTRRPRRARPRLRRPTDDDVDRDDHDLHGHDDRDGHVDGDQHGHRDEHVDRRPRPRTRSEASESSDADESSETSESSETEDSDSCDERRRPDECARDRPDASVDQADRRLPGCAHRSLLTRGPTRPLTRSPCCPRATAPEDVAYGVWVMPFLPDRTTLPSQPSGGECDEKTRRFSCSRGHADRAHGVPGAGRSPPAALPSSLARADLVPSELIGGAIGEPFGTAISSADSPSRIAPAAVVVHDLIELNTDLSVYLFVDTFLQSEATFLGTMHVNADGAGFLRRPSGAPDGYARTDPRSRDAGLRRRQLVHGPRDARSLRDRTEHDLPVGALR